MEMYTVPENANEEMYMIPNMEQNLHFTTPYEQVEAMYNEGAPEFVVDQGLYYPGAATNYGYYCTGFESPGEWEDHRRVFGVDGPDIQYSGAQNENLPFVYYTPSYGYAQSPYNPYNPYIPGAMIGADGQPYYAIPPYQNSATSPSYIPLAQRDVIPNISPDSLFDTGASINRPDGRAVKYHYNSVSGAFPKTSSNQMSPLTRVSEGLRGNGPSKQSSTHGSISSSHIPTPATSNVHQVRSTSGSISAMDNLPNGKVLPHHNQLKVSIPVGNGLSDFGSSGQGGGSLGKVRPKFQAGKTLNDVHTGLEALGEQNCGPRINRVQNQLAVKAYTTKAGDSNAQGNIIIRADQYNKDDLPVDYVDAKFFVIKSYSEDDVHKSVKYNVWSSTPHGNKKLNNSYEDAQRIAAGKPRGCPIFLFFSVNASGQFCGIAEMVGPVDFNKDMDFWQQDKWSGSFRVKWHIIKDVPNTSFRHIVLENNENKPVTNSRDTQEIMYKKGLEMLKIFKNHPLKTSLLDDFMYYEDRQKIMQEERGRLLARSFESPFLITGLGPPRKLGSTVELSHKEEKVYKLNNDANQLKKSVVIASQQVSSNSDVITTSITDEKSEQKASEAKEDTAAAVSTLKVDSLTINPKQVEPKSPAAATNSGNLDVVTVGSMPVRVNGYAESLGLLTVGTIPLDPRALQLEKSSSLNKKVDQLK